MSPKSTKSLLVSCRGRVHHLQSRDLNWGTHVPSTHPLLASHRRRTKPSHLVRLSDGPCSTHLDVAAQRQGCGPARTKPCTSIFDRRMSNDLSAWKGPAAQSRALEDTSIGLSSLSPSPMVEIPRRVIGNSAIRLGMDTFDEAVLAVSARPQQLGQEWTAPVED